jgi:hypothetical protein
VQPTDTTCQVGFLRLRSRKNREEESDRGCRISYQVLVEPQSVRIIAMKDRLLRLTVAMSAVLAAALAGGASLRGF